MPDKSKLSPVATLEKAGTGRILPARRFVRLDPRDNVIVAAVSLPTGTVLEEEGVTVSRAVPMGHKIATRPIATGEAVLKFGQIIGYATQDISPGTHVHVHNCVM